MSDDLSRKISLSFFIFEPRPDLVPYCIKIKGLRRLFSERI